MVYESILGYRDAQLADPLLEPWERDVFEAANEIAVKVLGFFRRVGRTPPIPPRGRFAIAGKLAAVAGERA